MGPGDQVSFGKRKSSQNCLKLVLIFWDSLPRVLCLHIVYFVCIHCTLLKVVGRYDSSVLPMSVMGFQNVWIGGMGG